MPFKQELPDWTRQLHHDGSAAFVSNPLPKLGERVTVRLRVPHSAEVEGVFVRSVPDGEIKIIEMAMTHETPRFGYYEGEIVAHQPKNDYHFKLMTAEGAFYYTAQGVSKADQPDWCDFKLLAGYEALLWVQDAVFYQIFPERFHNGDPSLNVQDGDYMQEGYPTKQRVWGEDPIPWSVGGSVDFFGGDLPGITQKLGYLEDLGVTALYLCPIFRGGSNHKYDIMDFWQVERHFGGEEALVALREGLDERSMRIILDITTNHISFKNPWYLEAKENPDAPTAEFFAYDPETGGIETWLGVRSLIKLNYASQKLRDVMYRNADSAMQHWLRAPYRIDGWRIDVANMTGNLRENQLDHEVFREMREHIKQVYPDAYLMGEHFHDGTPHIQGDELDACMNYMGFNTPARRWLGASDTGGWDGWSYADRRKMDSEAMAEQWQNFMGAVPYPIALQQFNQLDSHDTPRILHITDGDKALVKLGLALLMAFPGAPCVYYGTEIGLDGGKDPDNRRCMPWDSNDWDADLLAYTRKLIAWRKQSEGAKRGGFQVLQAGGDVVAFARYGTEETLVFVGNRGAVQAVTVDVALADIGDGTQLRDVLTGTLYSVGDGVLMLDAVEHGQALILEVVQQS